MTQLHLELNNRLPIQAAWAFGGNACHAAHLLRKDVQRHLRLCRDELGFRHVRCRGLLSDAMGVARPDGSFDFTQVEQLLDMLMEDHVAPFITLSDLPRRLARNATPGPGGLYLGPPKDWDAWHDLVRALATTIDGRYGCDAREWYFEVAGGPDGSAWTGTAEEYRKLYDLAAKVIKTVHPEFRVGGPGADGPAGLDDFLRHVTEPSDDFKLDFPRCDFVTFRAPAGQPADGNAAAPGPDALRQSSEAVRQKVTDVLGQAVPVICTEWSGPAGQPAFAHDACGNAASVCEAGIGLADVVQGAIYQDVSDIADALAPSDEAAGRRHLPFHGGRGLLTVNDVRKAAFHSFRLLGEHRGYHAERVGVRWVDPVPGLGCWASIEEYTLRLLCWYHPSPVAGGGTAGGPARFTVEGLSPSVRTANVEIIRPGAGSAFEVWVETGRPEFVNRDVLDTLEIASHPAMAEVDIREYPPRLEPGMVMQLTIQLPWDEPVNSD